MLSYLVINYTGLKYICQAIQGKICVKKLSYFLLILLNSLTFLFLVAEAGFEPVPKPYIFVYIPPFQTFV